MEQLLELAPRRHRQRTDALERLIDRYRREKAKRHLVEGKEAELHEHLELGPRLITMPNGAPFHVSNFSRRWWKPALARVFPEDTYDHRIKRHLRFYTLRATAVQWMVEDCEMAESDVANIAGQTVETQKRHYRKIRGAEIRPDVTEDLANGAAQTLKDVDST